MDSEASRVKESGKSYRRSSLNVQKDIMGVIKNINLTTRRTYMKSLSQQRKARAEVLKIRAEDEQVERDSLWWYVLFIITTKGFSRIETCLTKAFHV